MARDPYTSARQAALALLKSEVTLSRKEGGFLGHLAVQETPPSHKQAEWLSLLLEEHGLPPLSVALDK